MGELNRRMHLLLDDDRLARLRERAETTGISVAALVRNAIDRELEHDDRVRARLALESLLAAPPVAVGTPEEVERELADAWDDEIG